MENDPQKAVNSTFLAFFHDFRKFKPCFNTSTLHLLSCLYINDLEEGFAHLPEILNGMKLEYMGCIHPK